MLLRTEIIHCHTTETASMIIAHLSIRRRCCRPQRNQGVICCSCTSAHFAPASDMMLRGMGMSMPIMQRLKISPSTTDSLLMGDRVVIVMSL